MNLDFQGTNVIEGIFLNASASEPIEFTTEAFKIMNKLRSLKVCQDLKCGSGEKNYEVHVSTDFEFPSYELRYLYWDGYPLEYLLAIMCSWVPLSILKYNKYNLL